VALSAAEQRAVEDAAHLCRLSVASFLRVLIVEAMRHTGERLPGWQEVAAELSGANDVPAEDEVPKVKRPRSDPGASLFPG
jgi:hypothetical protein